MNGIKSKYNIGMERDVQHFLGIEIDIKRDEQTVKMHMTKYCNDLIEKFGQQDAQPLTVPAVPGVVLQPADTQEQILDQTKFPYRALVCPLLYLAARARPESPDVSFAVNVCARFMDKATMQHWKAAIRAVR